MRWHLAQNTVKVRGSTMDAFRAKTKVWKTATGQVDSDSNFRPIQANPNCVYSCSDNAWCPGLDYPDWHYEDSLEDGPSNWPNIEGGELCGHSQQSPIRIDPGWFASDGAATADCEAPLEWNVGDAVYEWTVSHKGESGHTLSVKSYGAKEAVSLRNAYPLDGGSGQHEKYRFDAFHFHWGPDDDSGSEHRFEGVTTTLELHFVHFSTDYLSVAAAVEAWADLEGVAGADMHTLAVAGFVFEEVDDNAVESDVNVAADAVLLQFVENAAMLEVWTNASASAVLSFSITDLVDADDFMQNYYHYWGSLTTPPC